MRYACLVTVLSILATPLPASADARGDLIRSAIGAGNGRMDPCLAAPEGDGCPLKTGYVLFADCRELDAEGYLLQDCAETLSGMMRIMRSGEEQRNPRLYCVPTDIDPLRMRRIFVAESERSEKILELSAFDALRYSLAKAYQCFRSGPVAGDWETIDRR